jgi:hypothetical protein
MMLIEGTHPKLTGSALARECFFDRLYFNADKAAFLTRIEPPARRALERGDIPVFTCVVGERTLRAEDELLPDFFPRSAMELVRGRLAAMSDADRNRQLAFITNALAASKIEGIHFTMASYVPAASAPPATAERLLSAARAIGDRLEVLASRGDGFAWWTGLAPDRHQRWRLDPVEVDLYGGAAGIALFLGYLGDVVDDPRYRDLALSALQLALHRAAEAGKHTALHGIAGLAGLAYAASHLGGLWEDTSIIAQLGPLAERILGSIEDVRECDVISGLAGDIHCLLSVYAANPDPALLAGIHRAARRVAALAQPQATGLGWVSTREGIALGGMAHGAAGIVYALARVAALTGDRTLLEAAGNGLRFERSQFDPALGNWRDLRPDTEGAMVAWCHGAVGIGAARLAMLDLVRGLRIEDEVRLAASAVLATSVGSNHCLCHGDVGNLDLLFASARRLGDGAMAEAAEARLAVVLESLERGGPLTGAPLGLETPGLFNGIAGTGLGLLRFVAPELVPSLLTLEAGRLDYSTRSTTRGERVTPLAPRASASSESDAAQALEHACRFLRASQRRDGTLRDFLLAPGYASDWMTAHAGFVLDGVGAIDDVLGRASDRLLMHAASGWGYNRVAPRDVDSTAQALWALQRRGRDLPIGAVAEFVAMQNEDGGFPTYHRRGNVPGTGWAVSHPDVTVVAAYALRAVGFTVEADRAIAWAERQLVDGVLPAYWWITPSYALWAQARTGTFVDRVGEHALRLLRQPVGMPDRAQLVFAALGSGVARAEVAPHVAALVAEQRSNGQWVSAPCMRVTDPRVTSCDPTGAGTIHAAVTGVFATMHAAAALGAWLG